MTRRILITILAIASVLNVLPQIKGQDYSIDKDGNVVVAKIAEGLALQKHDIYMTAQKYMKDAYKDTKNKIVINSLENAVVAGE